MQKENEPWHIGVRSVRDMAWSGTREQKSSHAIMIHADMLSAWGPRRVFRARKGYLRRLWKISGQFITKHSRSPCAFDAPSLLVAKQGRRHSDRKDSDWYFPFCLVPGLGLGPAPGVGRGCLQACCECDLRVARVLQARQEAGQQVVATADGR